MVLTSSPLLINRVFRMWEGESVPISAINKVYDVGVVLGGFSNGGVTKDIGRLQFSNPANRLTDALYLYKTGRIHKILISGGEGGLFKLGLSEAQVCKDFCLVMGVRDTDLLLETQSRNTNENALFTKAFLAKAGLAQAKCLLITSAFHIRRATGCFRKRGVDVEPFPVQFIGEKFKWDAQNIFSPDDECLWEWQSLLKEWIGSIVYWVAGYI